MNAVGETSDGDQVLRQAGPEVLPHLPGDAPVLAAHSVDVSGEAHGERRHIEAVSSTFRCFAKTEELFARKAELAPVVVEIPIHQVKRKDVMTSRDRRVGGEDGALPDEVAGFSVALTGSDELADALQREEGGMAFIAMPHGRIDA